MQKIFLVSKSLGSLKTIFKRSLKHTLITSFQAQLNQAVWQDIKYRHNLKKKSREFAQDFVELGEVFCKIFWDPSKGKLIGHRQKQNEDGSLAVDMMGNPVRDESQPVMSGDLVFERVFAFNVLRDPSAKSLDDSPYLIVRKMVDINALKAMIGDDPEKHKFLEDQKDDTFHVFDVNKGQWEKTKNQVMLRECYYRPCHEYPNGYFFFFTQSGVLFEGELPGGLFPIKYCGYDEVATTPRSNSIIKALRPYQAEINRTASKIAEHQITLGDDKILIQSGTKITHGGQLPGVRAVQYTGMTPTYLPGRSGDQYLAYLQAQIKEMYEVANVYEDSAEEQSGQLDAYAMLFRSLRNKKKFSLYAEKFEGFLIEICDLALRLAKIHYQEEMLIPAIGKREWVNIAEFKSSDDLGYQIKLEPQIEDVETKMGKQVTLTNILQYVGNQLSKDDIGKIIRNMPFANAEQAFGDLTIDFDNATNDILALDRGEYRPAQQSDNHPYIIKRLINRMKQSDFYQLPPQVQQMYQAKVQEHEAIEAEQQRKLIAAKAEYIPSGGYLVVCDFYTPRKDDPTKTERLRLPSEALAWLVQRLQDQGSSFDALSQLQQSGQAGIADQILGMKAQHMDGSQQILPQPQPQQNPGQASPMTNFYGG
jgi:hypothetical protein